MKRFAIIPFVIAGCSLLSVSSAQGQTKKPAAKTPAAAKSAGGIKVDASFKKVKGVAFKILKDVPGKNAEIGGGLEFNLIAKCDTLVLGDSRMQNGGKPVTVPVMDVKEIGQFQAVFPFLSAGDSVLIVISCDTILKTVPEDQRKNLPPWLKSGNSVNINMAVVSVKSKEDMEKEQAAAQAAQAAAAKEAEANAGKQVEIDNKILQDYFTKNKIKPTKTASGLYYTIKEEGKGPKITNGMTVSMNYTGKLMDGTPFDSNMDPQFKHVEPFKFPVGGHQVIAGWDEGIALFNKGTKATLYIPSTLAYGARGAGGSIGPNAVLMFDVEVVDIVSEK